VDFVVEGSGPDIRDGLMLLGHRMYFQLRAGSGANTDRAKTQLTEVLNTETLEFGLRYQAAPHNSIQPDRLPSHGLFAPDQYFASFRPQPQNLEFAFETMHGGNAPLEEEIGARVGEVFRSRVYVFKAERMNVGECNYGNSDVLLPNAQNLPEVLNVLQSN